jgi:hypothetical protein
MSQRPSANQWRFFSVDTEDGKRVAEYRVDGEQVVIRADGGPERRERINEGATAIQVARRMMSE